MVQPDLRSIKISFLLCHCFYKISKHQCFFFVFVQPFEGHRIDQPVLSRTCLEELEDFVGAEFD